MNIAKPIPVNPNRRVKWLVGLAIAALTLVFVIYGLAVRTVWGRLVDNAALGGRLNQPPQVVGDSLDLLSTISLTSLIISGAAILLIAIARQRLRLGLAAGAVILGANVTTQLLKRVIFDRPELVGLSDPYTNNSLPSGHATVAMSLVMALILVMSQRRRVIAAILGGAYALAIGSATVTAGWHRPSDGMTAYCITTAWTAIAAAALIHWRGVSGPEALSPLRRILRRAIRPTAVVVGTSLLAISFLGLVATLVALSWGELQAAHRTVAYIAGLIAMDGLGILLITALLVGLKNINLDPPH